MNHLISIIVPCYNQAQYLDECLQSILEQTYQHWECIIVNDGSADNTEEIALRWCEKDIRFKYLKKENGRLSSARNAGIRIAQGEWILPLDADDKISDNYTAEAIKVFTEYPETELVYCNAWLFGERNEQWILPQYNYFNLLFFNHLFCSSIFLKNRWIQIGGYDETLNVGLEDWDFWLRLLTKKSIVVKLPIVGFFYRQKEVHSHSMLRQFHESENRKNIINYIFKKQMHILEQYYDKSFLNLLQEYTVFEGKVCELKDNHIALAAKIKTSILIKAIYQKFKKYIHI